MEDVISLKKNSHVLKKSINRLLHERNSLIYNHQRRMNFYQDGQEEDDNNSYLSKIDEKIFNEQKNFFHNQKSINSILKNYECVFSTYETLFSQWKKVDHIKFHDFYYIDNDFVSFQSEKPQGFPFYDFNLNTEENNHVDPSFSQDMWNCIEKIFHACENNIVIYMKENNIIEEYSFRRELLQGDFSTRKEDGKEVLVINGQEKSKDYIRNVYSLSCEPKKLVKMGNKFDVVMFHHIENIMKETELIDDIEKIIKPIFHSHNVHFISSRDASINIASSILDGIEKTNVKVFGSDVDVNKIISSSISLTDKEKDNMRLINYSHSIPWDHYKLVYNPIPKRLKDANIFHVTKDGYINKCTCEKFCHARYGQFIDFNEATKKRYEVLSLLDKNHHPQ